MMRNTRDKTSILRKILNNVYLLLTFGIIETFLFGWTIWGWPNTLQKGMRFQFSSRFCEHIVFKKCQPSSNNSRRIFLRLLDNRKWRRLEYDSNEKMQRKDNIIDRSIHNWSLFIFGCSNNWWHYHGYVDDWIRVVET